MFTPLLHGHGETYPSEEGDDDLEDVNDLLLLYIVLSGEVSGESRPERMEEAWRRVARRLASATLQR